VKLLVTGAAGMLGRDVAAAAAALEHETIGLGHDELDVRDETAVRAAVARIRPEAIVNCAAFTDVDGSEAREDEAAAVNGAGAGHVAAAAEAAGAIIIHVSSDYVFDGAKGAPYVESDSPAPLSAYGRSKLAGEQAVTAAAGGGHLIVRSAWLYGAGGGNFVRTMLELGATRDEVAVVDDQVGSPTWTGHLAPALVELAARRTTGTLHLAGGGSCSWYELAREVFARTGLGCRVRPARTADLGRPAPRPALSALASERADVTALPPWAEGLDGFLAGRPAPVPATS
jgi:dTDP-4-dehydrorhamnose reductase